MSTMKDDLQGVKDEARDKLTADLAELKASFGKLRSDMMTLLHDAMGAGKDVSRTGADAARDQVSSAYDSVKGKVDDFRDRGSEQMEALGHKIEQNPVTAALIALGVGFLVAKILSRK